MDSKSATLIHIAPSAELVCLEAVLERAMTQHQEQNLSHVVVAEARVRLPLLRKAGCQDSRRLLVLYAMELAKYDCNEHVW